MCLICGFIERGMTYPPDVSTTVCREQHMMCQVDYGEATFSSQAETCVSGEGSYHILRFQLVSEFPFNVCR